MADCLRSKAERAYAQHLSAYECLTADPGARAHLPLELVEEILSYHEVHRLVRLYNMEKCLLRG